MPGGLRSSRELPPRASNVEQVTEYLENTMPATVRASFDLHLGVCPGCVDYLEQMRQTVWSTGCLRQDSLDPIVRDTLLDIFRNWKRADA